MSFGIGQGSVGCDGLAQIIGAETIPITGIHVILAGVVRTGFVNRASVSVQEELNGRNSCSMSFNDELNTFTVRKGEQIEVLLDGSLVFAGLVEEAEEEIPINTTRNTIDIECVDFNSLADRHLVTASFENQSFFSIVSQLITTYSGDEGQRLIDDGVSFDTSTIESPGPTFTKVNFDNQTLTQCFDKLAKLTSFWWGIDYRKVFRFLDRSALRCPFSIDDSSLQRYRKVKVSRGNDTYRNIQVVMGGTDNVGIPRVSRFKGDGEKKTFELDLPVARGTVPVFRKNGVVNGNVKIKGADEFQPATDGWYYQVGETMVSQSDGGTALSTSDTLEVTYTGQFDIKQIAKDEQEIARLKALESTSGVWEHLEEDDQIDDDLLVEEMATSLLRRYSREVTKLTLSTTQRGARPGQLMYSNLPQYGINFDMLITDVELSYIGLEGSLEVWDWQIKSADGEFLGGWADFWKEVAKAGDRPYEISANSKLLVLRQIKDVIGISDAVRTDLPLGSFLDDPYSVMMVGSPIACPTTSIFGDIVPGFNMGPVVGEPQHAGVS